MAKVVGATPGICVLFVLIITVPDFSSSNNINYETYDVDSKLPYLNNVYFTPLQSRLKRDTPTAAAPSVPVASTATSPVVTITPASGISIANNESQTASSTVADLVSTTTMSPTNISRPLLGVNGTGQLNVTMQRPTKLGVTASTTTVVLATTPKPVVVSEPITPPVGSKNATDADKDTILHALDGIDVPDNETRNNLPKNLTQFDQDYHEYYNSTSTVDKEYAMNFFDSLKNLKEISTLSSSYRKAMTVHLSFDFPFYGHGVRNVTVATGGFLYTGDYVHSWLAATQYIAPLMANFDTRISNDSFVRYSDNGTAFTVLWDNVYWQGHEDRGTFTFSVSLHDNGNIVFVYYSLPYSIQAIHDDKHPVKIGLSDAYIIDNSKYFTRRKTIYEYHRVNFDNQEIKNFTIITLYAQPTCVQQRDCVACLEEIRMFQCSWCPTLNKCSTGVDRKRQDWILKACDRTQIKDTSMCPKLGDLGNNAGPLTEHFVKEMYSDINSTVDTHLDGFPTISRNFSDASFASKTQQMPPDSVSGGMDMVLGLFIPLTLVMCIVMWIFYAYRNPHTKSGQLLIQYRPSQWSWKRGEARYTAATIHM